MRVPHGEQDGWLLTKKGKPGKPQKVLVHVRPLQHAAEAVVARALQPPAAQPAASLRLQPRALSLQPQTGAVHTGLQLAMPAGLEANPLSFLSPSSRLKGSPCPAHVPTHCFHADESCWSLRIHPVAASLGRSRSAPSNWPCSNRHSVGCATNVGRGRARAARVARGEALCGRVRGAWGLREGVSSHAGGRELRRGGRGAL